MSITIETIRAQVKADIARQFPLGNGEWGDTRTHLIADVDAEQPPSDVSLLLAIREAMFRHGQGTATQRPLAIGYRGHLQDCYEARI